MLVGRRAMVVWMPFFSVMAEAWVCVANGGAKFENGIWANLNVWCFLTVSSTGISCPPFASHSLCRFTPLYILYVCVKGTASCKASRAYSATQLRHTLGRVSGTPPYSTQVLLKDTIGARPPSHEWQAGVHVEQVGPCLARLPIRRK